MNADEMEKIKGALEAINKKYRKVSKIEEHIEMIEQVEKLLLALKDFEAA